MVRTAALILVLGLSACAPSLENEAREALQGELRDADSAKLRDLSEMPSGAICGQVNAKNAMGAYVGFTQFYAGGAGAFVDSPDGEMKMAQRLCNPE